ncbi:methionyl-tRNA formyltransferase [Paenibacillus sp. FSL H8-0537]|uniref:methionyl-tRNA formyltransferase n=1 Tax=Paenibacillus sp. FSL H8-0537 TaxID=2921399 RepID=UPI003100FA12
MKLIFLTGSHPRHLHIAKRLHEEGLLQALLIEKREELMPNPHPSWSELDQHNFVRHFSDRQSAEEQAFGEADLKVFEGIPVREVTIDQLNSSETRQWVIEQNPQAVVSYGVHKLDEETLSVFPEISWNIHGGLSPWYRGNITLFWPFYFLKPNWAGMTIHQLTSQLDGGAVIHHSVPELHRGEGLHDVACNAVKQAAEDLIHLFNKMGEGQSFKAIPQRSSGKLFTSKDWAPQHLRLVYNTFNNDIVDRYLDGELGHEEPKLVRAF